MPHLETKASFQSVPFTPNTANQIIRTFCYVFSMTFLRCKPVFSCCHHNIASISKTWFQPISRPQGQTRGKGNSDWAFCVRLTENALCQGWPLPKYPHCLRHLLLFSTPGNSNILQSPIPHRPFLGYQPHTTPSGEFLLLPSQPQYCLLYIS